MSEDVEFYISIDKFKEEYIKALLEHRNSRYGIHIAELELELIVETNGNVNLSFVCKTLLDERKNEECEFEYLLFTNDEDCK